MPGLKMPSFNHLDKVLEHAERTLKSTSHLKPTEIIDLYRRFLKIEQHRIQLAHGKGECGRQTTKQRSDLITVLLEHAWRGAWEHARQAHVGDPPKIALLAVGGFGRGELCPQSDIDILFLHREDDANHAAMIQALVEQVLYMMWDVGFKVGHATRSLPDLIQKANADLPTKTSLLEARWINGDKSVWDEFTRTFQKSCIKSHVAEYIEWRLADQNERHQKHGNTVFLQEPNIKNGCGGLRDYHNLLWIAWFKHGLRSLRELEEVKFLTASEREDLEEAYDFLLRLRTELHYQQKTASDILTLRLQGKIADRFAYPQRNILRRIEALMRDYYRHAQYIFQITQPLCLRIAGIKRQPSRHWPLLSLKGLRELRPEHVDGFLLHRGVLEAPDPSILERDACLLRAFLIAQQRNAELGVELEFAIRHRLRIINRSFIYHKSVCEMLRTLFSRKGQVGRIVHRMHEMGVLGRLFPEFAPLTCLVQHEFFHQYTADEHTLVCLEMLDKLMDTESPTLSKYRDMMLEIDRPHLLYLGLLLHDTGKASLSSHHTDESAANAVRVGRRWQLTPEEIGCLVFLTDHHLTMSETALRKNIEDEDAIFHFARIVQTQERLDMLTLLTVADSLGTSSDDRWTNWRDTLLWRLYQMTRAALGGHDEFIATAHQQAARLQQRLCEKLQGEIDAPEIVVHFETMPERYAHATSEELMVSHIRLVHDFLRHQITHIEASLVPVIHWVDYPEQSYSEVSAVTWDREKVFSNLTGAFAACGISILSANIYTRTDHIVIDTFRVTTPQWEAVVKPRDQKAVRELIEKAFRSATFDFTPLIHATVRSPFAGLEELDFPTRITFDTQASRESTLLEIQTPDCTGLLYKISTCLAENKINVRHARITTEKGAALDSFYITNAKGQKIHNEEELKKITQLLRAKILP